MITARFNKTDAEEFVRAWGDIPTITRWGHREQINALVTASELLVLALAEVERLQTLIAGPDANQDELDHYRETENDYLQPDSDDELEAQAWKAFPGSDDAHSEREAFRAGFNAASTEQESRNHE